MLGGVWDDLDLFLFLQTQRENKVKTIGSTIRVRLTRKDRSNTKTDQLFIKTVLELQKCNISPLYFDYAKLGLMNAIRWDTLPPSVHPKYNLAQKKFHAWRNCITHLRITIYLTFLLGVGAYHQRGLLGNASRWKT